MAPRTCVIFQPSFLPWRGYFSQLARADVFVFYDDVQYDKHGWRNRNRIKTATGGKWLTIPVMSKGNVTESRLIKDIEIDPNDRWKQKHLGSIRQNYSKAPGFSQCWPRVQRLYEATHERLADLTIESTLEAASALGIDHVDYVRSSSLGIDGGQTERLVRICRHLGATRYLTGPSAADYLDSSLFARAGIHVDFAVYDLPEYSQFYPPFDANVSIIDLLMMEWATALDYLVPVGATITGAP